MAEKTLYFKISQQILNDFEFFCWKKVLLGFSNEVLKEELRNFLFLLMYQYFTDETFKIR